MLNSEEARKDIDSTHLLEVSAYKYREKALKFFKEAEKNFEKVKHIKGQHLAKK